MKIIIKHSTQLVVSAIMLAFSSSAAAYDFMVDSICYNIIGANEVEVTKRDVKYTGEIMIPATVSQDGVTYQVTQIGNQAFRDCSDLTLIGIPEGVTSIGSYAFRACSNLEDIDFPNSLVSIGTYAFQDCSSFSNVYLPRNVADIAYNAFSFCHTIKSYSCSSLNAHYRAVDGVLFSKDMTKLVAYPQAAPASSYVVPSSVTAIGFHAFRDCDNLVSIDIPENVTWLGGTVFARCDNLVSLYLPDGITHMGVGIFSACSGLAELHLPASLDSIMNGSFSNCSSLAELTIPRNVSYIDQYAFYESDGIKHIYFEEDSRLAYIGSLAFANSDALETFYMPNSVTATGGSIFYKCPALKNVSISENLSILGVSSFNYCTSLTELYIPSNVQLIDNSSVANCSSLKKLTIGEKDATGSTIIPNCGILYNNNLVRLELGANVDSLSDYAISNLENLKVFICWANTPPKVDHYPSFSPSPNRMNAILYVRRASLEAYRTAPQWKDFKTILAIEDVGDVNVDGAISIADVSSLIDCLLDGDTISPLADVNLDGDITIADVSALIDFLLDAN